MAKTYATVVGVILLIWGLVGLFTGDFLGIVMAGLQPWLFVVAGVIGVWTGFSGRGMEMFAKVFGVIFTLGGILGFVAAGVMVSLTLDASVVANLVHLVAGLWGLWAGFAGGNRQSAGPSMQPPSSPPPPQQGGGDSGSGN